MGIQYGQEPFEITIRDECGILTWPDGDGRCVPLRVLRIENERVTEALARHDLHRELGVVPLCELCVRRRLPRD